MKWRALFWSQWHWARWSLPSAAALGALLAWIGIHGALGRAPDALPPAIVVYRAQQVGVLLQLHAAVTGLALALSAWREDGRVRHLYAMLLPVTRSWYASGRFAVGLTFVSAVAALVAVGGVGARALGSLPAPLHAYPLGLAVRWWLAAATAYGVFFALTSASPTLVRRLFFAIVLLVVADVACETMIPGFQSLTGRALTTVFSERGLFTPFLSGWMIVDV